MATISFPSFDLHPLSLLNHLISGTLSSFVGSSRSSLNAALQTYLFRTYDATDPSRRLPFTETPGVASLNHVLLGTAGALLVGVFLYSSLRTVTSASDARHHLQAVLPRVLVALTLGVVSLPLIQQAVNLNNALSAVVAGGGSVSLAELPWESPLSGSALQSASTNVFCYFSRRHWSLLWSSSCSPTSFATPYWLSSALPHHWQRSPGCSQKREAFRGSGCASWWSHFSCSSPNCWYSAAPSHWRLPEDME